MSTPPVHHLDIRAFRYATEVPDRVDTALRAIYPTLGQPDEPAIEHTLTEGHYGHRIDIHEAHLSNADQLRTVFDRLRSEGILEAIRDELTDRVTDETELFLRLDKQAAYVDGSIRLGDGIELRAKIEAYPAKRSIAIENLETFLEESIEDR